jgi:hypothetical protein
VKLKVTAKQVRKRYGAQCGEYVGKPVTGRDAVGRWLSGMRKGI